MIQTHLNQKHHLGEDRNYVEIMEDGTLPLMDIGTTVNNSSREDSITKLN
jgi:hypothetical protein